jgi:hypothetical protein
LISLLLERIPLDLVSVLWAEIGPGFAFSLQEKLGLDFALFRFEGMVKFYLSLQREMS